MKIKTRKTNWGIEINTDKVSEDIINNNQVELKETMINFLESVKDMSSVLDYHDNLKNKIIEITNNLQDILETGCKD